MDEKSKIPTPVISLIPLFVLVALLAMVIPIFGGDALLGGSQVSLLIASSVCVGIAMIKYNYKWSSLEEGMAKNIKKVTPAIIILLLIGAISGTWMLSGVVPTLIYYGLHTLTPQIFLASCCLICAIVSDNSAAEQIELCRHSISSPVVDHHRHHRRGLARNRKGTRIRSWVDCRRYHFGGLFR